MSCCLLETITGNTATAVGGGIECYNNSSPTITNNTISGNMGNIGTAASYDVRCSTSEITTQEIWGAAASYEARYSTSEITSQEIWDAATGLTGEPTPSAAGTIQTMNVDLADLPADTRVYFGIRTTNADANVSGLCNSPYVNTPAAPLPLAEGQMLLGDANGDCSVNLLDLVFISERLGQDVHTADNWRADVNGDGRIDAMDQMLVQRHLGAECR